MVRVFGARAAGAVLVGAVTVLVLAGCDSGSSTAGGSSSGATTATTAPVTTSSSAAVTSSPASTSPAATTSTPAATLTTKPAASSTTTRPAAAPVLVLETDGLGYVAGPASIRHVPFGTDAAVVKTLVAKALGGALTVNALPDCGQGPRTGAQRAGFSLLINGTKFVGWTEQGAKGRHLTRADGLGIGSTLAQVKKALPGVTLSDGSLGPEFTDASGFGGILDGSASTSKVTLVYAGETCFFR